MSTEAKTAWTPGPWHSSDFGTRGGDGPSQFRIWQNINRRVIADTYSWSAEDGANAYLIAAAPDLYEALAHCLTMLDELDVQDIAPFSKAEARAALARARGEVA